MASPMPVWMVALRESNPSREKQPFFAIDSLVGQYDAKRGTKQARALRDIGGACCHLRRPSWRGSRRGRDDALVLVHLTHLIAALLDARPRQPPKSSAKCALLPQRDQLVFSLAPTAAAIRWFLYRFIFSPLFPRAVSRLPGRICRALED
jgi:hypothetical protein